jgi:site-specific recombinase XerC
MRDENLPGKGNRIRLLGHANISTTQRYMHLDDRELAEAQDLVE